MRRLCDFGPVLRSPQTPFSPVTRYLSICHSHLSRAEHGDTLFAFCHIVCLCVMPAFQGDWISLVPLHGFSLAALRSLNLSFTNHEYSEILDLICSLPLLEDLGLNSGSRRREREWWNTPSTSPRLTGPLDLHSTREGIQPITRRLLDFPNGLDFAITVSWYSERDINSTIWIWCRGVLIPFNSSASKATYLSCVFPFPYLMIQKRINQMPPSALYMFV